MCMLFIMNGIKVAGSRDGLVTMDIPTYSKKDLALTADSVTAVVEIKATSSTVVRDGLDLVAVVDVSGSMRGDKIESVKKALQFVIKKLTPEDRLSIVTFESRAKRLTKLRPMTQAVQGELDAIVKSLVADGGTDIKAGLDMGLAVLADRTFKQFRTSNIFLMSDGKPEGATSGDPRDVDPGDVTLYTFGFGQGTDHKVCMHIHHAPCNAMESNTIAIAIHSMLMLLLTNLPPWNWTHAIATTSCSRTSPRNPPAERTARCPTGPT